MTSTRSDAVHGFTRVDEEARPRAWVECLDTLHAEPFYREYKARVRAILAPRPNGLYLEVGDRTADERVHYTVDDVAATMEPDGRWRFTRKDGRPW